MDTNSLTAARKAALELFELCAWSKQTRLSLEAVRDFLETLPAHLVEFENLNVENQRMRAQLDKIYSIAFVDRLQSRSSYGKLGGVADKVLSPEERRDLYAKYAAQRGPMVLCQGTDACRCTVCLSLYGRGSVSIEPDHDSSGKIVGLSICDPHPNTMKRCTCEHDTSQFAHDIACPLFYVIPSK